MTQPKSYDCEVSPTAGPRLTLTPLATNYASLTMKTNGESGIKSSTLGIPPQRRLELLIVCISAISGFLYGYDMCITVVALPLIEKHFQLSTGEAQAVVSVLMFGAVFGALLIGPLADWLGRKKAIIVTGWLFLIGASFMSLAINLGMLLVGRLIVGMAIGASGPCVSAYLSEISLPNRRGFLISLYKVMLCCGCLSSALLSDLFINLKDSWRYMLGITAVPAVMQLIGMPFAPESPLWFLLQKRNTEAYEVMKKLFGDDYESFLVSYCNNTESVVPNDSLRALWCNTKNLLSDAFRRPDYRKPFLLSCAIAAGHGLTGANASLYYSTYIFQHTNSIYYMEQLPFRKETGVALAKFMGVLTALFLVERAGRRFLLLGGTFLMILCQMIFAISPVLGNFESSFQRILVVVALYILIFAWNLSWVPLVWIIGSEILPNKLRSLGLGIAIATFWIFSGTVNQIFLSLLRGIGVSSTFIIFASITSVIWCFVYKTLPETKGLTFEQIRGLFNLHNGRDSSVQV